MFRFLFQHVSIERIKLYPRHPNFVQVKLLRLCFELPELPPEIPGF